MFALFNIVVAILGLSLTLLGNSTGLVELKIIGVICSIYAIIASFFFLAYTLSK